VKPLTWKEKEHDAKVGKRRFLERVAQEQDADKEIKNYASEADLDNSERGAIDWGHGAGFGTGESR
jgi:hypothetical protein